MVGAVMCQGPLHTHSAMCRLSYGLSQGVTVWLSYTQSHVFSYALTGVRAFFLVNVWFGIVGPVVS